MAATLVATIGASNANSYETTDEATDYFDNRIAIVPEWPGDTDDAARALITATKTLDAYAVPRRYKIDANGAQYIVTTAALTGAAATAEQRLAWPRTGMYDGNGNSLDWLITSITVADPTVITTTTKHRLTTGDVVFLFDSNSDPVVDGAYGVTVITAYTFSIDLEVTTAGTSARMTIMPHELLDATAEFAGQLLGEDRTLDSDVAKQKITSLRAGSVALSFADGVMAQPIPDAVLNLMPPSWFTDEITEGAVSAEWDIISSHGCCR